MPDSGTRVVWGVELFDQMRVGHGFSRAVAAAKSIAALAAGGTVFVAPPSRRLSVGVTPTAIDRIKEAAIDESDTPRLDKTFFKKATMARPPAKKQLTIRLDEDVLHWLKRHGKGYQTRINRILRVVMQSQPPRTAHR